MVDRNLKEHLADYYGAQSLPGTVASRLDQAAAPTEPPARDRPAQQSFRLDVRTKALVACLLALVLLAVGLLRQVNRLEVELAELGRQEPAPLPASASASAHPPADAGNPANAGNPADAGDGRLASTDMPNLVAAFFHADWCPRCPIVEPIYDEIAEQYGADDVFFVDLDLTDEQTRHQTSMLGDALGIQWLRQDQRRTGMITLIDREQQTVLATLTGPEQLEHLKAALGDALSRSSE